MSVTRVFAHLSSRVNRSLGELNMEGRFTPVGRMNVPIRQNRINYPIHLYPLQLRPTYAEKGSSTRQKPYISRESIHFSCLLGHQSLRGQKFLRWRSLRFRQAVRR